jgi:hypothetical protein
MHGFHLFAILFFALSPSAHAFVRTMSSSGFPLAWISPNINIRANPVNSSGLTLVQVSSMLNASYAAWNVPGTRVHVSFSQSSGNPTDSAEDGINAAYFSSNSSESLDWGVVALTQVFYDVSSGQIREADTAFNDNQFVFTANPGDTGKVAGGRTKIYLQDVATHEAGHLLGLDHSLVNLGTMIYTAFSGQYSLSQDETNAIHTVYPNNTAGGSLAGSIDGTEGGIFGAHVVAVNLLTGQVEAGALSNSDGSFRLGNVPAGKYAVMMEPFGNQISSVSSYYGKVDHRFCSGDLFRRRFYSSCDSQGGVSVMDVSDGTSVGLGTLAPSCSQMGNPGDTPASIGAAKVISSAGGASFGTMNPGDTHYYVVRQVSGALSARAMSFSLFSPIDVKIEITDMSGNPLPESTSVDNVAAPGPGGVTNYDSIATANVTTGDFLLKISSSPNRIPPPSYSNGYELEDEAGHYLVALSVNGDIAPTGESDMSSCVSVPNVAQNATIQPAPTGSQQASTSGCGSLDTGEGGGPLSGGMSQVLLVAFVLQLLSLILRLRRQASAGARR